MDARKRDCSLLIDGSRLKQIIGEQFAILGNSGLDALYYEMDLHGFDFEGDTAYSIEQLESFFKAIVGEDASMLMIDRIRKAVANDAPRKSGY